MGEVQEDFVITVEQPIEIGGIPTPEEKGKKETKAKPKAAATPKYKEPTKDKIGIVAASFQDVYSVADQVIGALIKMQGADYIDGLFNLDPDKAERLARSMIQINNSLPRIAERMNKYTAPAVFASTLLMDLIPKGLIAYGLVKSAKQSRPFNQGPAPANTGGSGPLN